MSLKKTMQIIHNHNFGGYRLIQKKRKTLFGVLRDYLRQKYKQTIDFFPTDEEVRVKLHEEIDLCSIIVIDKHGYSSNSLITSIRLDEKNEIVISTDYNQTMFDAENNLMTDDLFNLCDTLEKYEVAMEKMRVELSGNGEWRQRAINILSQCTDAPIEQVTDFVTEHWMNLEPDDGNIFRFISYLTDIQKQ